MTFTGDVTLNSGAVWNETTNGAVASFSFGGNFINNATTFTAQNNTTAVHTFTNAGKTISGSTTAAIPYLTINGTTTNSGTLTVSTVLAGTGALTNSSTGTLNLSGTGASSCAITALANAGIINRSGAGTTTTTLANFTNTGTINISGSGTITGITNNAGGIVNHSGSSTITSFNNATATSTLNISATPTVPTFTTLTVSAAGNTVNYNGAGAQSVKAVAYSNLIFSGTGAKSIVTGTSVAGNLSIAPTGSATSSIGAGLNINVGSLTLGGVNKINGTWGSTTATLATYHDNTYFAPTTGYITVNTDIRLKPAFSGLTASQSICNSVASVALGGTLSAPGPVYPQNGEAIVVKINGITQNATIVGNAGIFSINFNVSAIPASGISNTITYSYAGYNNLLAADDNTSTTLTINGSPLATVASQSNLACFGVSTGQITIQASGGLAPYTFSIHNGLNSDYTGSGNPYTFNNLPAGDYRVRVKDSNQCESIIIP